MKNQNTGPAPAIVGVIVSVLCLGLFVGAGAFGVIFFRNNRPAAPQEVPTTLEEVKNTCADGQCIEGCLQHAAQAVGYEKYPPVMDSGFESELVSYKVQDDRILDPSFPRIPPKLIVYQRNSKAHARIWDYFKGMVPLNRRPGLREFVIYSGGESGAQFSPTDDGGWILRVNVLEATDPEYLTHALVHEFGHFLTLNPTQQVSVPEGKTCEQQPLYQCPAPDSYANQFFVEFWQDLYPDWMSIKGASDINQRLYTFYQNHSDQFVTEYAASQPLEDIAESWTAFITQPKPAGDSVADQKVLFFYQYPELVEMRYEIMTGICTYEPPAGK